MLRILTRHRLILDLLQHLISETRSGERTTTTVIACWTKRDFLDQLATAIADSNSHESEDRDAGLSSTAAVAGTADSDDPNAVGVVHKAHAIHHPTLGLLAASEQISLAFCPSIFTLRGFVSAFAPPPAPSTINLDGIQRPHHLVVLDAIALHHGTSEYTLQGLSQTLAAVVAVAHRTKIRLELVECRDAQDPVNPHRGPALWDSSVPLLNGSVRIADAGSAWAGRLTGVRKIVERWFEFEHDVDAMA